MKSCTGAPTEVNGVFELNLSQNIFDHLFRNSTSAKQDAYGVSANKLPLKKWDEAIPLMQELYYYNKTATHNYMYADMITQIRKFGTMQSASASTTPNLIFHQSQVQEKENEMSLGRNYASREQAEALAREAAAQLAKIDYIEETFGKVDNAKNGTILWADITYTTSDTVYNYVFVKANEFWYSTESTTRRYTFEGLVSKLTASNVDKLKVGFAKRQKSFI